MSKHKHGDGVVFELDKAVPHGHELKACLEEMMVALFESAMQADSDFCGAQREWHLPRLKRAMALMIQCHPLLAFTAMQQCKNPYGDPVLGEMK